ncbi:VTT domain-containing protein [Lactococcus chungangensis]|uniref:VTT domain-containing protein n=1 Tax=Pseudolactococcus chungangensis TaxID=451457 RepID=UPI0037368699
MMLINFILHIDQHIYTMAQSVGSWTYLLLFLIIFVETAAVVMPFLPGDSLLFAAGALAANPEMPFNIWIFLILFFFAAFLGDTSNFFIGHTAGYKLINHKFFSKLIKPKHIEEAELYFEKNGSLAIILGRYIPIIRTFVPFVAGISQFSASDFIKRAFIAALSWSLIATGAGYLFGNISFVKTHFSVIILAIIFVTLLPSFITVIKSMTRARA